MWRDRAGSDAFRDRHRPRGEEKRKGRLAPGFAADLAVLSQDVLTIPTPQLPATTSLLTIVDGEVIFADPIFTPPN